MRQQHAQAIPPHLALLLLHLQSEFLLVLVTLSTPLLVPRLRHVRDLVGLLHRAASWHCTPATTIIVSRAAAIVMRVVAV